MAPKKKARGKRGVKGGDIVRIERIERIRGRVITRREWRWCRYSSNHEYINGSLPETFTRKAACRASAERAMTKCPIVEEK